MFRTFYAGAHASGLRLCSALIQRPSTSTHIGHNAIVLLQTKSSNMRGDAGADKVKAALQARNLKVGGTPLQRAQRLILCATKPLRELPASAFVAGAAPAATLGEGARTKRLAAAQQVANVECKVLAVVESLGAVVDDTHGWVEKKLAQNYEELKQDIGREDFDIGGDDSDEEVRPLSSASSGLCSCAE